MAKTNYAFEKRQKDIAKKKKKEAKRLAKAGVADSTPEDVQVTPVDDDQSVPSGDT